jgi:hypothetical protein
MRGYISVLVLLILREHFSLSQVLFHSQYVFGFVIIYQLTELGIVLLLI